MSHQPVLYVVVILTCLVAVPAQELAVTQHHQDGQNVIELQTPEGPISVHRTRAAVLNTRVVATEASPVIAVLWDQFDAGEGRVPWYALSLDGKSFSRVTRTSYEIKLKYARFDPLVDVPGVPTVFIASASTRLWIVQYETQGTEAWRDVIRAMGGTDYLFLADHANVWDIDPRRVAEISALPFVRWIAPYHPAYRIEPELMNEQLQGYMAEPVRRINILTLKRGITQKQIVAKRIRAMGGTVVMMSHYTHIMRADLTLQQIAAVAHMDEVQYLDRHTQGGNDMDIARDFHGTSYVDTNFGYDGTGVRGEVLDGGTQTNHPEFLGTPPILHGANTSGSHGTSTYGQIFAAGVDAQATGTLHNGQGVVADYAANGISAGTTDRYAFTQTTVNTHNCVFQTNSWGHARTLVYNSFSTEMDTILFDLNLSVTQSQSNANNQMSRPEAWAKNVIGVGGVWHRGTLTKADDQWTTYTPNCFSCSNCSASIGPAADGRMKPDLASFYELIYTTTTTSAYTTCFGGTSGATPIVGGNVGLFYQMWHDGIFGNSTSASVWASRPQNTTAKAFMMATGSQWDFSAATRAQQGFGHPDMQKMYDCRNQIFHVDETDVLAPLASTSYSVFVAPGEAELKVVMVYRDPPGTTSAAQHRINDLDLTVVSPGGAIYRGNNGLAAGQYSTPGGSANTLDTNESVFVQSPQSGSWTVTVTASELNQDNHTETGALDADYALVVKGAKHVPTVYTLVHEVDGANIRLGHRNIPSDVTQGYTLLSLNLAGAAGAGPIFGIWIDPLVMLSLTTPAAPNGIFHWTWPVGPAFFPAQDALTPIALLPSGLTLDSLGVAASLGYTNVYATQVIRITVP
ncbi:MAG: peptidase S8 [Planctomycetes bacterium]|nr:peptidase S8 [Planctomycetota bacterium]